MMMYFMVILGLSLVSAEVLPEELDLASQNRIVGGDPVNIEEIPYQVSLNYRGRHRCGGSILNEKFVLTAAHCTDLEHNTMLANFRVRTGSNHSESNGQVHRIGKIHKHKLFNRNTYDYDFSILELVDLIKFDNTRRSVRLLSAREEIPTGTMLRTSGWGATQSIVETSFHVRAVSVPVVNKSECIRSYPILTDRMLCAGYRNGGKDACQGDSGGPIVRVSDGVLVGVVSGGKGCARPGYPGVYAKISSVREWIYSITRL
uniref:trypsin n=1 Tax=Phlebotomus perniciosus TaxID=13204 RepID=F4MI41_PHLPE